jgi:hypothetical protein
MEHNAFSLFMIALSIPLTLFGVRMSRWHKEFHADAVRRAHDGRAQLEGRTLQEWIDQLRFSTFALFRYRRLMRAEAAGDPYRGLVDTRPFAELAPDPEKYAASVLGAVVGLSFILAGMVLAASDSPAIAGIFLLAVLGTGLASSRPLLTPQYDRG